MFGRQPKNTIVFDGEYMPDVDDEVMAAIMSIVIILNNAGVATPNNGRTAWDQIDFEQTEEEKKVYNGAIEWQ